MSETAILRMELGRSNKGLIFGATAWVGVACLLAMGLSFAHRPASQRAVEDTAQMERFATLLGHAAGIAPYTARAVEQLMRTSYDCEQMQCAPAIATRNRAARSKLRHLLTASALPDPNSSVAAAGRRVHARKDN